LLTVSKLFEFKNRLFTIPTLNDSNLINDFISFRFPKKPAFLARPLNRPPHSISRAYDLNVVNFQNVRISRARRRRFISSHLPSAPTR